jgi:hypothetical protein
MNSQSLCESTLSPCREMLRSYHSCVHPLQTLQQPEEQTSNTLVQPQVLLKLVCMVLRHCQNTFPAHCLGSIIPGICHGSFLKRYQLVARRAYRDAPKAIEQHSSPEYCRPWRLCSIRQRMRCTRPKHGSSSTIRSMTTCLGLGQMWSSRTLLSAAATMLSPPITVHAKRRWLLASGSRPQPQRHQDLQLFYVYRSARWAADLEHRVRRMFCLGQSKGIHAL